MSTRKKTRRCYYTTYSYFAGYYDLDLLFDDEYDVIWETFVDNINYRRAQVYARQIERGIMTALIRKYIDKDYSPVADESNMCNLYSITQFVAMYNNDPELAEMMAKLETGEVYPMEINEWLCVID